MEFGFFIVLRQVNIFIVHKINNYIHIPRDLVLGMLQTYPKKAITMDYFFMKCPEGAFSVDAAAQLKANPA